MPEWKVVLTWVPKLIEWIMSIADRQTREKNALIGTWYITSATEDYVGTWSFRPDRTVIAKWLGREPNARTWQAAEDRGHWELTDTYVRITWASLIPGSREACFDNLLRPIKPDGIHGDCWTKQHDRWQARKLCGP